MSGQENKIADDQEQLELNIDTTPPASERARLAKVLLASKRREAAIEAVANILCILTKIEPKDDDPRTSRFYIPSVTEKAAIICAVLETGLEAGLRAVVMMCQGMKRERAENFHSRPDTIHELGSIMNVPLRGAWAVAIAEALPVDLETLPPNLRAYLKSRSPSQPGDSETEETLERAIWIQDLHASIQAMITPEQGKDALICNQILQVWRIAQKQTF